jgi:general secretion pathway protein L
VSLAQEILDWLQKQLIKPVKTCLAQYLGRDTVCECHLRVTASSGLFYKENGQQDLQINLNQFDETKLTNWLGSCFGENKRRIRVEVDNSLIMRRNIRLPIASKSRLSEVIAYEMDRFSPFNIEDVYFHFTPAQAKGSQDWLHGDLIVAQKQRLDPWYEILSRQNTEIDGVTLVGDDQPLSLIPSNNPQLTSMDGKISTLLWLSVTVLLMAALISPIWQQRQIAIELERAMQAAQVKASKIIRLQEQLSQRREAIGLVSTVSQGYLPVSEVLLELTRLIPEGSWTSQVTVLPDRVDLSGESDQASDLIPLLERSAIFEGVRFKSPLVKSRVSDKEKFDLTMKFSKEPVE